jgi:hypothetical protein
MFFEEWAENVPKDFLWGFALNVHQLISSMPTITQSVNASQLKESRISCVVSSDQNTSSYFCSALLHGFEDVYIHYECVEPSKSTSVASPSTNKGNAPKKRKGSKNKNNQLNAIDGFRVSHSLYEICDGSKLAFISYATCGILIMGVCDTEYDNQALNIFTELINCYKKATNLEDKIEQLNPKILHESLSNIPDKFTFFIATVGGTCHIFQRLAFNETCNIEELPRGANVQLSDFFVTLFKENDEIFKVCNNYWCKSDKVFPPLQTFTGDFAKTTFDADIHDSIAPSKKDGVDGITVMPGDILKPPQIVNNVKIEKEVQENNKKRNINVLNDQEQELLVDITNSLFFRRELFFALDRFVGARVDENRRMVTSFGIINKACEIEVDGVFPEIPSQIVSRLRNTNDTISIVHGHQKLTKPRGFLAAFNIYVKQIRPLVLKEPGMKKRPNNEINKVIGARWNSLNPIDKIPFEEEALQDKKRYELELAAYNAESVQQLAPPQLNDRNMNMVLVPLKITTAYGQFASQDRTYVLQLTNHNCNLGKYLSSRWQNILPHEKVLYETISTYAGKVMRYELLEEDDESSLAKPASAEAAGVTTSNHQE